MSAAVRLRNDYDARRLHTLAKEARDANQTQRLLAPTAIYDGSSRAETAEIGGVGRQTVRDWMLAFNTEGPPGLIDEGAEQEPLLSPEPRDALKRIFEAGDLLIYHFAVWNPLFDAVVVGNGLARQAVIVHLLKPVARALIGRPKRESR